MPVSDKKVNVLVVDDEPQILTAIGDLLENEFTVWTANDGQAALDILAHHEMAVILSDQRMPGMSGAEFLGRARCMSDATRILVTGYSDLDALVTAVNLGQIHAYLSKPWNPLELQVVVRTAADRWRLGRSLDQERNLLRALMDNIPDAIFFKDRELTFTRLNGAEALLLGGKEPVDLVGMRLSEIVSGDQVSAIERQETAILQSGIPVTDQLVELKDELGGSRWLSITKAPICQNGEVSGLVGISRDVTIRKEAEDYLRSAHDRLQQAVEERTAWLQTEIKLRSAAEEQARSAREIAENASRAKTTFLANMSHELRTPLNAIIGFSELAVSVMDKESLTRYGEFLDNISESAHHLLRVISDILDVSRVEVGKVVMHESDVDMVEVVQSVIRLIDHAITRKRQIITRDLSDGLPLLRGDDRLIKQILLNIVSNAAKFTPECGEIHLELGMRDGGVFVSVTDSGIGIAPEDMAKVLQPFGQAENAISPKQEGTGLGLPLAKGFADLHGATLSLNSEVGKGTRVTVFFPASRTIVSA